MSEDERHALERSADRLRTAVAQSQNAGPFA
jgi:hypothetical protein